MTWRALGLVLVVVIGGMTGGQSQAVTTDLSGTWVLKLRLDRSEFRDRPTARRVQGSVTLAAEPVGNGGPRLNGAAWTRSGRAPLERKPFGLGGGPWGKLRSTTNIGPRARDTDAAP